MILLELFQLQQQLRFLGNKFLSFLNAKADNQLNSNDFANVRQFLVMHNSLNILLAYQSGAKTSFLERISRIEVVEKRRV